jgi:hypothetical protein
MLYFGVWNESGGYAWGAELEADGNVVWSHSLGEVGNWGAYSDDQSRPQQTVFGQALIVSGSGIVTELGDSSGEEGSSAPIRVGSTVRVTSDGLYVRYEPGTSNTPIGEARPPGKLRVVGGPVVLPSTSDTGRPLLRNWWLVTGWDGSGSTGWSSSRFLQVSP